MYDKCLEWYLTCHQSIPSSYKIKHGVHRFKNPEPHMADMPLQQKQIMRQRQVRLAQGDPACAESLGQGSLDKAQRKRTRAVGKVQTSSRGNTESCWQREGKSLACPLKPSSVSAQDHSCKGVSSLGQASLMFTKHWIWVRTTLCQNTCTVRSGFKPAMLVEPLTHLPGLSSLRSLDQSPMEDPLGQ